MLANKIALVESAQVDVSGDAGGGTALIGGDYQGKGQVPNATETFVGSNVSINADAISTGNGGKVILWADEATRFYGNITARGGNNSGNGGLVEVSGKENLAFDGSVDVGASAGTGGQLLLDPASVVIGADGTNDNQLDDGQILATDAGDVFFISATRLLETLNTGNVTIAATNDITVNNDIDARANTNTFDLALTAPAINLNASIFSNGGNITFDGPVLLGSSETISTGAGAGNIAFNSTLNAVNGAQELTLTAGTGNIMFGGAVGNPQDVENRLSITSTDAANITANSTIVGDRINLRGGNITLNGDLSTSGTADNSVTLSATAGSITTKNIITSVSSGDGGPVNMSATGNITTENINTKTSGDPDRQQGGSVTIDAGGNVALKDITTTLGHVKIDGRSIVTGKIDTSYYGFYGSNLGDVTLTSTSGDIVVHSIKAQDDIDITAAGLFRAVGTLDRQFTYIVVKDSPELINFFVSQGFNEQEVKTSNLEVTIVPSNGTFPISLVALSNRGSSIIIRHGGAPGSDNGNLIQIYGGDSPPNFVIGPFDTPVAGPEFIYFGSSTPLDSAKPFPQSGVFSTLQRNSPISTSLDQVPNRFPNNISGTAGAIVVGGGYNSVMNQALRNRSFEPTIPAIDPVGGTPPDPVISTPVGGSTPDQIISNPVVGDTSSTVVSDPVGTAGGSILGDSVGNVDDSGSSSGGTQIATQIFQQQDEKEVRMTRFCRKAEETSQKPTNESDRSDEEDCEEIDFFQLPTSQPELLRLEFPFSTENQIQLNFPSLLRSYLLDLQR